MSTVLSYLDVFGPRFFVQSSDKSTDLSDLADNIVRFEYHSDEKKQDQLTLVLNNSTLKYNDDPRFVTGLQFTVRWGYANDVSDTRIATIVRARPKFPNKGVPTMELVAFDLQAGMNTTSNPYNWGPISSSAIAKKLAKLYNFDTDIEESNDIRPQHRLQPAQITDYQYLLTLASKLNWDFYVEGTVLHFHKKRYGDSPNLTFIYFTDSRGTLLEFEPEIKMNRPPKVGASGASAKDGKAVGKKDGDGGKSLAANNVFATQQSNGALVSTNLGVRKSDNSVLHASHEGSAKVVGMHADAARGRVDMKAVKAKMRVIGTPRLLARSIVRLEGLGKVYSGNWRVSSVKHVIEAKGNVYVTECELSRNALNTGTLGAKAKDVNNKDAAGGGKPGAVIDTQTQSGQLVASKRR